jgi:hypothetical protein
LGHLRESMRLRLITTVALATLGAGTMVLPMLGSSSASGKASVVVANAYGLHPAGVHVFSLPSGRSLETVTSDASDTSLQVTTDGYLYLARPTSGPNTGCYWSIMRIALESRRVFHVLTHLSNASVIAVSRDDRMLAYETQDSGSCTGQGGYRLHLEDLSDGRTHYVGNAPFIESMTWSPNDRDLLVVAPGTGYSTAQLALLPNAWRIRTYSARKVVPCPGDAPYCGQHAPEYDARGRLYYVAVLDPNTQHPCLYGSCSRQIYDLTLVDNAGTRVLASHSGIPGVTVWQSISLDGSEDVYTVPNGKSPAVTFLWENGTSRELPHALDNQRLSGVRSSATDHG